MTLSLHTPLYGLQEAGLSSLWEAAEAYLTLGSQKYKVVSLKYKAMALECVDVPHNIWLTAVKVISYVIIVLPLCALLVKVIYRSKYTWPQEYIVIKHPPGNPGMFSVFNTVVGFLYDYEQKKCAGVKVHFENQGLYYDANQGENWWQYYCEPLEIGEEAVGYARPYSKLKYMARAMFTEEQLSRDEVHALITKYIKIKPHIKEEVEAFAHTHFVNKKVLGVHYRGTDKSSEAVKTSFDKVVAHIEAQIKLVGSDDYVIFVATDQQSFFERLSARFPGKVIAKEHERSSDNKSLHENAKDPFKQGKEAMVDALLLAKSSCLIRTSSNLSLWSTYFNPKMHVIELSQRHIGFDQGWRLFHRLGLEALS